MQRLQPVLILVLALVCGGTAAYMASGWLKARSQQAQTAVSRTETTPVAVAAKEIVAGSVLTQDLVKIVDWPRANAVAGAISEPEKLKERVVRYPLAAGEIILEKKLAPVGTFGGMAGIIENDRRAVTVKVDEASGVAGFIMPGNHVDVMLTMDRKEFGDDPIAKIVLQNLLVLGIGQDLETQKSGEKPRVVPTVTLEVSPDEGEKLALASKEGHITLALRGWTQNAAVSTNGIRASELVQARNDKKAESDFEAPIASPAAPPKKAGVEVLRGTERETVQF